MRGRMCLDRQFVLEELPHLTSAQIRVLMCLHLHHSVERGCWPGVKSIADLTGLHRGTVHDALTSLKDKDLIDIDHESNRRRYRLPVNAQNVLRGGPEKWSEVPSRDDRFPRKPSPVSDEVSPGNDRVSSNDVAVSPGNDSECHRETTDSRMSRAGACAHAPEEVAIEGTHEETPPAAAGACINAQGNPEPEVDPSVPFLRDPQLNAAARRVIDAIGLDPALINEARDKTVTARRQGAR